MAEKKPPQYASVRQNFGCDPAVVHCPICGESAYRLNKQGKQIPPCHHLAFIYVGEVAKFVYQSQDFEKKFKNIDPKDVNLENLPALLEKVGYDNKMLAIEVAYGAMVDSKAAWYTDVYGYDYGTIVPCPHD